MTSAIFSLAYLLAVSAFLIRAWIKNRRLNRKIRIKIRAIRYAEKYQMLKKLTRG